MAHSSARKSLGICGFDMFDSEYESYPCECGDTAVPLVEGRAAITTEGHKDYSFARKTKNQKHKTALYSPIPYQFFSNNCL
jgi:hypothetical protein